MKAVRQTSLVKLAGRAETGQGLAEYALILAFIAVLAIAAVGFLGGQINVMLSDIGNKI
jgi:Flp pilus assembly pilin Flp